MHSLSTIALTLLSVVCLTTNDQDFCPSYQKNDLRVIINNLSPNSRFW